jgi:hypothetical protein
MPPAEAAADSAADGAADAATDSAADGAVVAPDDEQAAKTTVAVTRRPAIRVRERCVDKVHPPTDVAFGDR